MLSLHEKLENIMVLSVVCYESCFCNLQKSYEGYASNCFLHMRHFARNLCSVIYKVHICFYGQWFYRVDLCHQANDEEDADEENSSQQALLESSKSEAGLSNTDSRRRCCSFQGIHVGSRQKFVIVVWVRIVSI